MTYVPVDAKLIREKRIGELTEQAPLDLRRTGGIIYIHVLISWENPTPFAILAVLFAQARRYRSLFLIKFWWPRSMSGIICHVL